MNVGHQSRTIGLGAVWHNRLCQQLPVHAIDHHEVPRRARGVPNRCSVVSTIGHQNVLNAVATDIGNKLRIVKIIQTAVCRVGIVRKVIPEQSAVRTINGEQLRLTPHHKNVLNAIIGDVHKNRAPKNLIARCALPKQVAIGAVIRHNAIVTKHPICTTAINDILDAIVVEVTSTRRRKRRDRIGKGLPILPQHKGCCRQDQ